MGLALKKLKFTYLALAITVVSGCISDADRSLIQSYANKAGVSYAEAQSSMRVVQGALKNLGFYSGRINGIPSVETNNAMQAYVNEQRRKTNSRVAGAPQASEIAKLISDYKSFLETLNSSNGDSREYSEFSAEMESRSDSYSSDPVTVSETRGSGDNFSGTVYSRDGSGAQTFTNESDFQSARESEWGF
jgi:hypothetical protein